MKETTMAMPAEGINVAEAIETAVPAAEPEVNPVPEVEEKPYTFRKLGAPDVFLMFNIVKDIGISEFTAVFGSDGVINTLKKINEEGTEGDSAEMMAAMAIALEIGGVVLGNIGKCEKKIYELLAKTSNLTVEEITADGNAVMFMEMVIDFLKKDEFPDFFRVVSKLFK